MVIEKKNNLSDKYKIYIINHAKKVLLYKHNLYLKLKIILLIEYFNMMINQNLIKKMLEKIINY